MISSLIHTNRGPDTTSIPLSGQPSKPRQLKLDSAFRAQARSTPAKPSKGPCATLIVAPTSLLNQWAEELERCSKPGTVKTLVWHGQNRLDLDTIIEAEDEGTANVVITSYGVLTSEHAKVDKSGKLLSPIFTGMSITFPSHLAVTQLLPLLQVNGYVSCSMKLTIASPGQARQPERSLPWRPVGDGL